MSEELTVGYENPYYGDVGVTNRNGGITSLENTPEEDERASSSGVESDLSCTPEMFDTALEKGAVGGVCPMEEEETSKMKLFSPQCRLDTKPKCVMNTYDTPPQLVAPPRLKLKERKQNNSAAAPLPLPSSEKNSDDSLAKNKLGYNNGADDNDDDFGLNGEENYYDEVKCQYVGGAYDVPRSFSTDSEVKYMNGQDCDTENVYYNEKEENLYESMEHLRAAVEEKLLSNPDGAMDSGDEETDGAEPFYGNSAAAGAREENHYVPLKNANDESY